MKILVDIGHPAHVHYFRNFIRIMQNKGHDFFISARNKEVSQILLEKYDIPYFDRGRGSNKLSGKVVYVFKADWSILKKARFFKPDLFLSFASPYAAHVSTLTGKPHISFTDTENARLGILSFAPFTDCILTPDAFLGNFGSKHVRFKGFMELCYLHPKYFKPNRNVLPEIDVGENEPYALLRFVSWVANHDFGQSGIPDDTKTELVKELTKSIRVLISSEGEMPAELIKYKIKVSPEKMHDVLANAAIYIGEGATMASECTMLGTPAIYANSLTAGTIEEQAKYGLLFSYRNSDSVFGKAEELLNNPNLKQEFVQRRDKMLKDKIDVTEFMVWFVENYPESVKILKDNPGYQYNFM